jgi:hypothetical protein
MFDDNASRSARRENLGRILTLAALVAAALTGVAGAQTFTPAIIPDMAAHVSFSLGASWVDYDNDGDLDLYVSPASRRTTTTCSIATTAAAR